MNFSYFFAIIVLATGVLSAQGQINTMPEGVTTYNLPATGAGANPVSFFSLPLINDPVFTGAVSAVTATSISIATTPWTVNQYAAPPLVYAGPATPYFVKFLTGLQAGRVVEVLSNDVGTLTLDTSDNTSQTIALNVANLSVAAGDTFEVFPGDTLTSLFGANTQQSPLALVGGGAVTADSVGLYNIPGTAFKVYYYNTSLGFWVQTGTTTNANNTTLYPYTGFAITRRANEVATSFTVMGRVAEVSRLIRIPGGNIAIYDSTGYPVDMPLSLLNLGSNWAKSSNFISADTVSVFNSSSGGFDNYYQLSDNSWRKYPDSTDNVSSFVIPAGTTVGFLKRLPVNAQNPATSYLQPVIPYSTN